VPSKRSPISLKSNVARGSDVIAKSLGAYLHDTAFESIALTNAKGEVLFVHGKAAPATLFSGPEKSVKRVGDSMVAWTAKDVEGHPVGRVGVAVSTRRLLEGQQLRRRILTLSGGVCAVALLMSLLFFRLYINPLVRLTQSTLRALKELNVTLEARVNQRTEALADANRQLEESLRQLRLLQRKLVDASRAAGMADVATNVLHNVGNILNSVNVSAGRRPGRRPRLAGSGLGPSMPADPRPRIGSGRLPR